jgi:hypothetical protein
MSGSSPRAGKNANYVSIKNERGQYVTYEGREKQRNTERRTKKERNV